MYWSYLCLYRFSSDVNGIFLWWIVASFVICESSYFLFESCFKILCELFFKVDVQSIWSVLQRSLIEMVCLSSFLERLLEVNPFGNLVLIWILIFSAFCPIYGYGVFKIGFFCVSNLGNKLTVLLFLIYGILFYNNFVFFPI